MDGAKRRSFYNCGLILQLGTSRNRPKLDTLSQDLLTDLFLKESSKRDRYWKISLTAQVKLICEKFQNWNCPWFFKFKAQKFYVVEGARSTIICLIGHAY